MMAQDTRKKIELLSFPHSYHHLTAENMALVRIPPFFLIVNSALTTHGYVCGQQKTSHYYSEVSLIVQLHTGTTRFILLKSLMDESDQAIFTKAVKGASYLMKHE